jgi:hypothetical protein
VIAVLLALAYRWRGTRLTGRSARRAPPVPPRRQSTRRGDRRSRAGHGDRVRRRAGSFGLLSSVLGRRLASLVGLGRRFVGGTVRRSTCSHPDERRGRWSRPAG